MKFSSSDKELIYLVLEKICHCLYVDISQSFDLEEAWSNIRIGFVFLLARKLVGEDALLDSGKPLISNLGLDNKVYRKLVDIELGELDESFENLVSTLKDEDSLVLTYRLSLVYGFVLEHNVARGDRLQVYKCVLKKKQSGSFFTPPKLAIELVDFVVSNMVGTDLASSIPEWKILDPACGPGIFLIAAYSAILVRIEAYREAFLSRDERLKLAGMLYGVDLDPAVVYLARLNLWLLDKNLDASILVPHIKVGNALVGASIDRMEGAITKEILDQRIDKWLEQNDYSSAGFYNAANAYFHFQYEFPEVFSPDLSSSGFDAVVGNPPWEIGKPNSREFFRRYIKDFYSFGKQEALEIANQFFKDNPSVSQEWSRLNQSFKNFTQWIKKGPLQFQSNELGFQFQGKGDSNLYKCFLEQAYYLSRKAGVIAMITPAGIYSDIGAKELRNLFLHRCNWLFLKGYENTDRTFDIHRSFKYCLLGLKKSEETESIKTSFLNSTVSNSTSKEDFDYPLRLVDKFSPNSRAILEVESSLSLSLLEKIYSNSQYLGDTEYEGFNLKFSREFDMTLDSGKFVSQDYLNDNNFFPDSYGNWLKGNWQYLDEDVPDSDKISSQEANRFIKVGDIEDVYVPLYEGRMVGQFESSKKVWVNGRGRRAIWKDCTESQVKFGPQYFVRLSDFNSAKTVKGFKIGYLAVGSDTNKRTMIASCLNEVACGNAVPVISLTEQGNKAHCHRAVRLQLVLTAILNSFVFDFALRRRMSGNNLNYFVLKETPLPSQLDLDSRLINKIVELAASLNLKYERFAEPLILSGSYPGFSKRSQIETDFSRALLDVLVLELYKLNFSDLSLLLDGVSLEHTGAEAQRVFDFSHDISAQSNTIKEQASMLFSFLTEGQVSLASSLESIAKALPFSGSIRCLNAKGFWRVNQEKPLIYRHTVLTLVLAQLKESIGLSEFLDFSDNCYRQNHEQSRKVNRCLEKHALNLKSILNLCR